MHQSKTSRFLGLALLMACCMAGAFASGKTYYVDSEKGLDRNKGTSPEKAWKSLDRVNAASFAAGDSILLKRGGVFPGALAPKGSGAEGRPILLGSYGEGPRPIVSAPADGSKKAAIALFNQEYWKIEGLETVGGNSRGIYVSGKRAERPHTRGERDRLPRPRRGRREQDRERQGQRLHHLLDRHVPRHAVPGYPHTRLRRGGHEKVGGHHGLRRLRPQRTQLEGRDTRLRRPRRLRRRHRALRMQGQRDRGLRGPRRRAGPRARRRHAQRHLVLELREGRHPEMRGLQGPLPRHRRRGASTSTTRARTA